MNFKGCNFKGCCYYPYGGWVTSGLLVSSASALAATCYSAISCQFLRVSFTSTTGCFEESFQPYGTGGNVQEDPTSCLVGVGLYQWLQPFPGTDQNWSEGSCAGYQETMLAELNEDPIFQVARGFGVFGVLLSIVIFLFGMFMCCLALNIIQIFLLRTCSFLAVSSCGLTFLLHRSQLCHLFDESSCKIDQGAMAMIAACLLWFVNFLITMVWIKPDNAMSDESTDREEDDAQHRTPRDNKSLNRSASAKQSPWKLNVIPKNIFSDTNCKTPETVRSGDEPESTEAPRRHRDRLLIDDVSTTEQLEVYVSRRLDNTEKHTP